MDMQDRMTTNRFKVASHLTSWLSEFRMYHRKDGQIVKLADDEMSATRIAVMAKRYAKAGPLGPKSAQKRRGDGLATGLDFDIFAV